MADLTTDMDVTEMARIFLLFVALRRQIAVCQHFEPYIETYDGKFLCHGARYTVFPSIPDSTELLECPFQFFTEFPDGTFENKLYLSAIDVSVGRLETIGRDTFKGAKSLQSFNASRCNLLGDIPTETFFDYTPYIRLIDLSHNRNYVFTSKPFECLEHLVELRINDTDQSCDLDTWKWIDGLPPGTVIGYECDPPEPPKKSGETAGTQQWSFLWLFMSLLCLL